MITILLPFSIFTPTLLGRELGHERLVVCREAIRFAIDTGLAHLLRILCDMQLLWLVEVQFWRWEFRFFGLTLCMCVEGLVIRGEYSTHSRYNDMVGTTNMYIYSELSL
jgi:hypothetical protein